MTLLVHPTALDELAGCVLLGRGSRPAFVIERADTALDHEAYRRLRHEVFVDEQGVFDRDDADDVDDDPRGVALLARSLDGTVLGGVRLAPVARGRDIGWWQGSRLAVARGARSGLGVGPALVRAASALAEELGVVRFDAAVQPRNEALFTRLGWRRLGSTVVGGRPHVHMHRPIDRFARLAASTKSPLGDLLGDVLPGDRFLGDDAAPVPGSHLVAACDAILPAMVERDPEWAGWCAVLVNVNDVLAMGARPVGLLDAVAGRDREVVARVLSGLRDAAAVWDVPVLGGHTQLGTHAALSVTALGRVAQPVAAGGASVGDRLRLTADLGGGWRPGYRGAQWDSSTSRAPEQLRSLAAVVPALRPTAAKDVSMAGVVGSIGMLAEASGVGAVLSVEDVPTPSTATMGDWLSCFPGFAMVTTEPAERATGVPHGVPDIVTTATCGHMEAGAGVDLLWPDGHRTPAVGGAVTGLGPAAPSRPAHATDPAETFPRSAS